MSRIVSRSLDLSKFSNSSRYTQQLNLTLTKGMNSLSRVQRPKTVTSLDSSAILNQTSAECSYLRSKLNRLILAEEKMHELLVEGTSDSHILHEGDSMLFKLEILDKPAPLSITIIRPPLTDLSVYVSYNNKMPNVLSNVQKTMGTRLVIKQKENFQQNYLYLNCISTNGCEFKIQVKFKHQVRLKQIRQPSPSEGVLGRGSDREKQHRLENYLKLVMSDKVYAKRIIEEHQQLVSKRRILIAREPEERQSQLVDRFEEVRVRAQMLVNQRRMQNQALLIKWDFIRQEKDAFILSQQKKKRESLLGFKYICLIMTKIGVMKLY